MKDDLTLETWHHIAVQRDNDEWKVFFDGFRTPLQKMDSDFAEWTEIMGNAKNTPAVQEALENLRLVHKLTKNYE